MTNTPSDSENPRVYGDRICLYCKCLCSTDSVRSVGFERNRYFCCKVHLKYWCFKRWKTPENLEEHPEILDMFEETFQRHEVVDVIQPQYD